MSKPETQDQADSVVLSAILKVSEEMLSKAAGERMGVVILAVPFRENTRLAYGSNIRREDAINLLKEWLIQASGEEEWMEHIK